MNNVLNNIGLGLAVALLVCLFPMPYGYYTLVRFVAMIIFGCMAYSFYKEGKLPLCIIASSLALLFQPLFKIALGRTMWNVVDVIVAIVLVFLWFNNRKVTLSDKQRITKYNYTNMNNQLDNYVLIVNNHYPLFFKDKEVAVANRVINKLKAQKIEISEQTFLEELNKLAVTEEIIPFISSPIRIHHIYEDILKVKDSRANYTSNLIWWPKWVDYDEWRKRNSELTDEVCASIVEENYPKKYNNKLVVNFIIATIYQDKQELTFDVFITQMKYLESIGYYNNWTLEFQKDLKNSTIVNELIYKIYVDAYFQTVKLSQYSEFDDEAKEYFGRVIFPRYGNDNVKKWLALFEDRMDTKHPPFFVYAEPNGDITFTREDRGVYNYQLPPKPSKFTEIKWKLSKSGFNCSFRIDGIKIKCRKKKYYKWW